MKVCAYMIENRECVMRNKMLHFERLEQSFFQGFRESGEVRVNTRVSRV